MTSEISAVTDHIGLPVEERTNEHVIRRTYDKAGQIATLTSTLGPDLTYERNEFGELTCFSAGQAEGSSRFESKHEYDSLGFELERMLPGGVTQSFTYDNIGRLIDSKTRHLPRYTGSVNTIGAVLTGCSVWRTSLWCHDL